MPFVQAAARRVIAAVTLVAVVGGFSQTAAQADPDPQLRILLVAPQLVTPELGPLDIYIDDRLALSTTDMPIHVSILGFEAFTPGMHTIEVFSSQSDAIEPVSATTIDLAPGTHTTLALVGDSSDGSFTWHSFESSPPAPEPGIARLSVVHAMGGAGPVDATWTATGETVIEDLDFVEASPYIELSPGIQTLELFDSATGEYVHGLESMGIHGGIVYTVVAYGPFADGGYSAATTYDTFLPEAVYTPTATPAADPTAPSAGSGTAATDGRGTDSVPATIVAAVLVTIGLALALAARRNPVGP